MSRLTVLVLALLAASTGSACAVTIIAGNGPERLCYIAALTGHNPEQGLSDCDRALRDSPLTRQDRAGTYDNRGILHFSAGRYDQAMRDYEQSLVTNPDLGDAHLNRGTVLILRKQYPEALVEIETSLKLGLSEPQNGYYDRAIVEEDLGRTTDAYHDYQKALELAPTFAAAAEQLKRFTVVQKPGS